MSSDNWVEHSDERGSRIRPLKNGRADGWNRYTPAKQNPSEDLLEAVAKIRVVENPESRVDKRGQYRLTALSASAVSTLSIENADGGSSSPVAGSELPFIVAEPASSMPAPAR